MDNFLQNLVVANLNKPSESEAHDDSRTFFGSESLIVGIIHALNQNLVITLPVHSVNKPEYGFSLTHVFSYKGNFIKKRLQHRWFPVNIAKMLRTTFLYNAAGCCF